MPIDVAGAAVGAAFNELFSLVNHLMKTVAAFRGQLKKIQTTLGNIEPIIKDIDKFNNRLDRSPEEMAPIKVLLEEGQGLVSKCLKIHKLNLCKKYRHSRKLAHFNAALLERFQLYISLLNARDKKEVLADVKEIGGSVKEVKEQLISRLANGGALRGGIEALGDLAVPVAPDFIVGSEVEAILRKLEEQLLEGGVSVIVVTAPGGCGKTTLLKKLCHEAAIEGMFD
ncbi:uncharacterized protein J3R85_005377 [Psidium guajava]|nr:uncharacterized protein J3R85_005377 [Psidium guajava]